MPIGSKGDIEVGEARGVVARERGVVVVVENHTSIKGNFVDPSQNWQIIPAVGVNCVELSDDEPSVKREKVRSQQQDGQERGNTFHHNLNRMRIGSR